MVLGTRIKRVIEIDLRLCEIFFYKSKKDEEGFLKFVRLGKSILRERRVFRLYIKINIHKNICYKLKHKQMKQNKNKYNK